MTVGPLADVAADGSPSQAVPAVGSATPSTPGSAVARGSRPNRGTDRPTTSAGSKAAAKRAATLSQQGKAISKAAKEADTKAKAARAAKEADTKARAARAAKAAAEKARYAKLGYEPGTTDPREIARQMMKNKWGWGADQYGCLDNIVMRESMWQINATNPSSGAYGIPQSLPGSKMATVAPDWQTNPATQITWMLGYLKDRYGTPCGGWAFKSSHGWY